MVVNKKVISKEISCAALPSFINICLSYDFLKPFVLQVNGDPQILLRKSHEATSSIGSATVLVINHILLTFSHGYPTMNFIRKIICAISLKLLFSFCFQLKGSRSQVI
jgi:hypothetical protein